MFGTVLSNLFHFIFKIIAIIIKAIKSEIGKAYQTPLIPNGVNLGRIRINGIRIMNCLRIDRNKEGMA